MKQISINYKTLLIALLILSGSKLIAQTKNADTAKSKNLKEVTIKADKPIIKQEVDRITYDLQADPENKVSNVLEMMRKVPFVTLDANENILLKGNSSYKFLINGKPSSMMERDAKSVLRSIPASTIQRIEVYTTPPAKYDAEGLGGIINIITYKKIVDGYNGTVDLNERTPSGPGFGTSVSVKSGKFGLSAFGGGSLSNSPLTTNLNVRNTTGTDLTYLNQQGTSRSNGNNGYLGTELSYEIDSLNLVSGQFNINGSKSNGNSTQQSILAGPADDITGYDLTNTNNGHGKGFDAALNYQLGFKNNKSKLLTFSYRYYKYDNRNQAYLKTTDRVNYDAPDYDQDDITSASEQTVQLDFVQSFKKWSVEAGVKGIFRDNKSDFQYNTFNAAANQFERDSSLSNQYNSTQNILAAYNTWQYATKSLTIKAGVRVEQTITDADFISTASAAHQRYLDIVPSIAINMLVDKNSGLNLGFSQRLKRPGINKLNPFVDRSNPNFQSYGNPDLGRVLISDIRLGYNLSGKASLNVAVFYDFGRNLDLLVSNFDKATNITYSTYKNLGKVTGIGNFIGFSYPFTKSLNFSVNSNIMYFTLDGPVDGVMKNISFVTVGIYPSLGYALDGGWRINANVDINGRNPTGLQGSSNGVVSTGLSVNKQLIKNKLSLSAGVRNPFTKYRNNITETSGTDFTQTIINQNYFRSYTISLNYNFGKLKDAIKKTRRGINNDDGAR
ncbi:TonB-dependent receptor [Mucilaginibacter corticis]|uniref:TonB-dependent receptor n=1 Tax=Mucilaginibacter corticis TaxID=2597670 RepID=A0A556MTT5_9SPHI|nr:outer membrane beta-barrel family protein [Mucilaginibacter corticis]TSJ43360.1 TonB-dependent receptor [Mucilaginibacter corticis]